MREPVRSKSIPRLKMQRSFCMRKARLARSTHSRDQFVELAREVNRTIVRSDIRARRCFDHLKQVLASLS